MHRFFTGTILNLFIVVPALMVLFRFRFMDKTFLPFILLIWFGTANESISVMLAYIFKSNAVNSNIYVLLEYILVMWQFYLWSDRLAGLYIIFVAVGTLIWAIDNLYLHSVLTRNSSFRIFYSSVIIFFSIDQVNKLIVFERRSLLRNPIFLVCLSFLIYYSSKAFAETFFMFDLKIDNIFNEKVIMLMIFSNFISNILYTIAIVCIPPKLEFTLPY